jgi:2-iminobutanoate/2-iminopropanoate deaminase
MTKFHNPSNITRPLGKYSHGAEVPGNARWLAIAGQVGVKPDGAIAEGIEEQCRTAYTNILAILADAGMDYGDVVKTTVFLTDPRFVEAYRKVRDELVGDYAPPSTLLIVAGLASPDLLVEIEATAAKA